MTSSSNGKIIIQLHNFASVNLCSEFMKIALGLGAREIVFSKGVGSAASSGIPIAQKMAFSAKANFLVLRSIQDTIELLKPDEIFLFIREIYANEMFDPQQVVKSYQSGKTILLVFGGSSTGLSRKELDLGRSIFIKNTKDVGCLGQVTLALYLLREAF